MVMRFEGRRVKWWVRVTLSAVVYVVLLNIFGAATGADNTVLVLGSLAGFASAFIQENL